MEQDIGHAAGKGIEHVLNAGLFQTFDIIAIIVVMSAVHVFIAYDRQNNHQVKQGPQPAFKQWLFTVYPPEHP